MSIFSTASAYKFGRVLILDPSGIYGPTADSANRAERVLYIGPDASGGVPESI